MSSSAAAASAATTREKLLTLLARGSETQLHEVQGLVQEESASLLIRQPIGFAHAALFMAVEQNCRDEVILCLLNSTCWYSSSAAENDVAENDVAKLDENVDDSDGNDDNDNQDHDSCWKFILLLALDRTRRGTTSNSTVFFALLQAFPQWVQCDDLLKPHGHLFYWALALRSEVAREMIQKFPQLALLHTPAPTARYPIHVAAELHDRATVELLLETYPEGLYLRDHEGRLPLHLVLHRPASSSESETAAVLAQEEENQIALLRFLCNKMDRSIFHQAKGPEQQLFLHEIALSETKYAMEVNTTQVLIEQNPSALLTPDTNGNLPIHLAVGDVYEAYPFIQALIQAAPESLQRTNRQGLLPLHIAAGKHRVATVSDMVDVYPEAVVARDRERGQTPLHIMLDLDMFDADNAARMIELRPDVLFMQDIDGKVPLHYVVKDYCQYFEDRDWQEAVELIAENCPAAILVHDHVHGKNPMHDAARFAVPWMVMETLLELCPAGVFDVDEEGNIPLFYAAGAKSHRHGDKEDRNDDIIVGIYNERHDDRNYLSNIYALVRHDPSLLVGLYFQQCNRNTTQNQEDIPQDRCDDSQDATGCTVSLSVPAVACSRKRKREAAS